MVGNQKWVVTKNTKCAKKNKCPFVLFAPLWSLRTSHFQFSAFLSCFAVLRVQPIFLVPGLQSVPAAKPVLKAAWRL